IMSIPWCSIMFILIEITDDSNVLIKLFYRFNTWFEKVTNSYTRGVKKTIKSTPLVLIILLCIFVGTVWMFQTKPTGFIPAEDTGMFIAGVTLPEGASASRTDAVDRKSVV